MGEKKVATISIFILLAICLFIAIIFYVSIQDETKKIRTIIANNVAWDNLRGVYVTY